jgi:uncharacterized membrane protein
MEEEKKSGEKILDLAGDMVENYRNLITIKIVEHSSLAGAASILGIFALVITVFILLFAGIGFAWWLGEELRNMKAGFFIVCGIYAILLIILILISKKMLLPSLRNMIIKKIYEQD